MFNRVKLMMAVALGRMLGSAPLSLHRAAMDHNRTVDALRAVRDNAPVLTEAPQLRRPLRMRLFDSVRRLVPSRIINRAGMHWGPNGAQECARRMRQIAAGTLTLSNGLIEVDTRRTGAWARNVYDCQPAN